MAKELGLSTCEIYDFIGKAFVKGTAHITSRKNQTNPKNVCLQVPWICNTFNIQVNPHYLRHKRYGSEAYREYHEKAQNPYTNFDIDFETVLARNDLVEY